MNKNIEIILLSSEFGCGKRGASLGPEAVMLEDFERRGSVFKTYPVTNIKADIHIYENSLKYEWAKNIEKITEYGSRVISTLESVFSKNHFPLIISGDHSNAIGTVSAFKNFFSDKKIGIIWIDAHADLHSPHTTPSGNIHGMALGVLLGDNNISEKIRHIDSETQFKWNNLLKLGSKKIEPKILPQDIVFIDLRDYEQAEFNKIKKNNIKSFSPVDIKQKNIETIAAETLEYLKNCDYIYLSFDVDSLDPEISTGTGTPSENGLKLFEAKKLLKILTQSPKIAAIEFTEINPLIDNQNKMAKTVLEIIDEILI